MRRGLGGPSFLALVTLLAASCSGSTTGVVVGDTIVDPREAEYVEALSASWSEDAELPSPATEGPCLAEGYVDAVGVDAIEAAGVTPESIREDDDDVLDMVELDAEQADGLAGAFIDCVDLGRFFLESSGTGPEAMSCFRDALVADGRFRTGTAAGFAGEDSDEATDAIFDALAACDLDPSVLDSGPTANDCSVERKNLETAAEAYKADHGEFPESADDVVPDILRQHPKYHELRPGGEVVAIEGAGCD
jgi:hypothetical protein